MRIARPIAPVALVASLVLGPATTKADERPAPAQTPREERLFDTVRIGVWGSTWAGTRLVGEGSIGRVSRPALDLELAVRRYFTRHLGIDVRLQGFPLRDDAQAHVRGDLGLDVLLFRHDGATPFGITGVLGLGGDTGRYPYAGRFYPRIGLRGRVHAGPSSTVELAAELLPAAFGPTGRVFQHRSELAFGWSLFQAGFRVSHAFHDAGVPERTFVIQELSLFVGIGLLR